MDGAETIGVGSWPPAAETGSSTVVPLTDLVGTRAEPIPSTRIQGKTSGDGEAHYEPTKVLCLGREDAKRPRSGSWRSFARRDPITRRKRRLGFPSARDSEKATRGGSWSRGNRNLVPAEPWPTRTHREEKGKTLPRGPGSLTEMEEGRGARAMACWASLGRDGSWAPSWASTRGR
jgi:hypothetical protein